MQVQAAPDDKGWHPNALQVKLHIHVTRAPPVDQAPLSPELLFTNIANVEAGGVHSEVPIVGRPNVSQSVSAVFYTESTSESHSTFTFPRP